MEVHIVVKGDTLWKIARQYGIPFEDLKRVNAHLANPDYIVPGMKIFLPKKHPNAGQQGTKGDKKEQVKQPEKMKVPVPKPPKTEVMPTPAAPIPLPKAPTPVSMPKRPTPVPIPITLPPAQMESPTPAPPARMPAPEPAPAPMPMQIQMQMQMPVQSYPMAPCMQPIIGIPCGWMPIYDADCYPFMHSGQIQAMHSPEAPMQQAPMPMQMPLQPTHFPMPELESPILPVQTPVMEPEESPLIEGWKLIESPEFMAQELPSFVMPPAAVYPVAQPVAPAFLCDESPDYDLQPPVPCQPQHSYIPQMISPVAQPQWNPAQFGGYPAMQQPSSHPGCGCGCPGCNDQQAQQQHHQPMHQPMMVPLYYGQPCGCPTCMQQATQNGMPAPYNGSNWYGAY